jgi:hypothetical protein
MIGRWRTCRCAESDAVYNHISDNPSGPVEVVIAARQEDKPSVKTTGSPAHDTS